MNAIAKMYPKLSAVELSAILMKGAAMSAASLERDSGFNSGSSEHEDDLKSLDQSSRDGIISPENSSEDSVEVKLPPTSVIRNKRKSTEPLRIITESESLGPIKKRIRYEEQLGQGKEILDHHGGGNPFRPWAPSEEMPNGGHPLPAHFLNPADLLVRHPGVTTLHRAISIKPLDQLQQQIPAVRPSATSPSTPYQQQPLALVSKKSPSTKTQERTEEDPRRNLDSLQPSSRSVFVPPQPIVGEPSGSLVKPLHPRNYKNMTRERRIEANARERTRVHTISAAYEKLRQAVPSYSNSQKLSKLSILRIACSYILTLSRMTGEDYSADGSEPSLDDCVELVTKTIQTEGKIKKKKDD